MWQQIFALDAKYNANRTSHPNFRTLYIRRRNQLLKQALQLETTDRKEYLRLRAMLLNHRYGNPSDQLSTRSRSICSRLSDISDLAPTKIQDGRLVPTKDAEASLAMAGSRSLVENYAFAGVHHIFDQHSGPVNVVRFAHNDRSRLACAGSDGVVSLCDVTGSPPSVTHLLCGHSEVVTDCDWSSDDDLLVTSSLDGTLRLWDSPTGNCLRTVHDAQGSSVLSCVFQPSNNNMVISGNKKGVVSTVNMSAGIYPKGGSCRIDGAVTSLAAAFGGVLWAGSDKGTITSFSVASWRLTKHRRILVNSSSPITCLSWRQWASREACDPSLLVNCAADVLCLYRMVDKNGSLVLRSKFPVRHRSQPIKSAFCPLMSFRPGACVVTGSEDACVYFLDIAREQRPVFNKLQGHSTAVLGVSFNYDESLLASSDAQGLIIVWKRSLANEG